MIYKLLFLFPTFSIFSYFINIQKYKIFSTINALQCTVMVLRNLFNLEMFQLNYIADSVSKESLLWFSSYLLIDILFYVMFYMKRELNTLLILLHHTVGSLGIYMIATNDLWFFIGFYFAMTEFSTLFLNLYLSSGKYFSLFYFTFLFSRILTIPFPLYYLYINIQKIYSLNTFYFYMTIYATNLIILINLIWAIFLTKKYLKFGNNKIS